LKELSNKKKASRNRGFFFTLRNLLKEFFNLIKISVFNNQCLICESPLIFQDEKYICRECRKSIDAGIEKYNTCNKCSKRIRKGLDICGECDINPPIFERHISYSVYDERLRDLILKSKYKEVKPLLAITIKYYLKTFERFDNIKFDYILPVPMDMGRVRKYNHILAVATTMSKELKINLMKNNLTKIKETEAQAGLTMAKRLKNLNGAFKVMDSGILKNKTVLLIDDVYTTGTTVKKCSEELVKSGAIVYAITLARSI